MNRLANQNTRLFFHALILSLQFSDYKSQFDNENDKSAE